MILINKIGSVKRSNLALANTLSDKVPQQRPKCKRRGLFKACANNHEIARVQHLADGRWAINIS